MDLIEKKLEWGGTVETVYFRELNGGDLAALADGQKLRTVAKNGEVEIDLGAQVKGALKLVQLGVVDANGKQVYPNINAVYREKAKKLRPLMALAREVYKDVEDDDAAEADAGNVSAPTAAS